MIKTLSSVIVILFEFIMKINIFLTSILWLNQYKYFVLKIYITLHFQQWGNTFVQLFEQDFFQHQIVPRKLIIARVNVLFILLDYSHKNTMQDQPD